MIELVGQNRMTLDGYTDFNDNNSMRTMMRKKSPRRGSLSEYMAEILKNAVYEKGEQLNVIVAEAPDLPGCVTQAASFEEARENLVDAIEVWLMSGLRSGEDPPVVNGCRLAITTVPGRPGNAQSQTRSKA